MIVTVIILIVVVILLAAAAAWVMRNRRRAELQNRFGPEYDRAVDSADSRKAAEQHLTDVAQRRDELTVRDLDPTERHRYEAEWEAVQARFVDEPGPAVDAADTLISTVMRERGYPVDDFEERADLVAADHPDVVQHYRDAHEAHERHRSSGDADTEDLRQAFVHYRALFSALVDGPGSVKQEVADRTPDRRTDEQDLPRTYPQETR
jgi:ABC-type nickel/cobalt efflux system permease component RcnA